MYDLYLSKNPRENIQSIDQVYKLIYEVCNIDL